MKLKIQRVIPKAKILLDADVYIHLHKADKLSILNDLYPNRLGMLDIVLSEITKNKSTRESFRIVKQLLKIEIIDFPTDKGEYLSEYSSLGRTIEGNGERATLIYCKNNHDIIASSNTNDITSYCTQHGMAYLTTLDIFSIAIHNNIMTKNEVNICIGKILNGSYLCCDNIDKHIKNHFEPNKYFY